MKTLILVATAAVLSIVGGAAEAKGRAGFDCVNYFSPDGGRVKGSICRGGGPETWQEINNQMDSAARWQETSESPGRVVLFDASRSYTVMIDSEQRQVLLKAGPKEGFRLLYKISSVQ